MSRHQVTGDAAPRTDEGQPSVARVDSRCPPVLSFIIFESSADCDSGGLARRAIARLGNVTRSLRLAGRSNAMAPTSTPSYLTQYPSDALPEPLRNALAALEPEFDVDLHAVTKQMLWEFSEGLNRRPDDQDLDEHLPMMCVCPIYRS